AEHVLGIELACSVRGLARLPLRGRNGAERRGQDDRGESRPWQRLAQLRGERRPAMKNHDAPSLSESKRTRAATTAAAARSDQRQGFGRSFGRNGIRSDEHVGRK